MVTKRITVYLDVDLIRQLDAAARSAKVSRSELIAALVDAASWSDVADSLNPQED